MTTADELAALRVAASLIHAFPSLRGRLRRGGEIVVEVRGHPEETGSEAHATVISPCEFRATVARAQRAFVEGRHPRLGWVPTDDLAVEIGTPSGGAARACGLYRTPWRDGLNVWCFGSTLDAEVAYPLGRGLVDESLPLPGVVTLGLRRDPLTAVTIAYAQVDFGPDSVEERAVIELLESLYARWAVHELLTTQIGRTHDDRAV